MRCASPGGLGGPLYVGAGPLLTAGFLVALLSLWGLARMTEEVLEGETVRIESRIMLWMDAQGTPALDVAALDATVLGRSVVDIAMSVVAITCPACGHEFGGAR